MGNDYIENDLLSPTTEEIRDACPLAMVLTQEVLKHAALIAQPCVARTQGESLRIVTFDLRGTAERQLRVRSDL